MSTDPAVAAALVDAGLPAARAVRPLGGSDVRVVTLVDGRFVVAKRSSAVRIRAEAAGLEALRRSGALLVPAVYGVHGASGAALLLTEYLEPSSAGGSVWHEFGASLARHHAHALPGRDYGLDTDNFLGATPQSNGWCADWVTFLRLRRFGPQIERARSLLSGAEMQVFERVVDRLDDWLDPYPRRALLHGDLWSGNAVVTRAGVAVIDPAVSIGDGLADIAMMRLFGGFPRDAEEAYFATRIACGCPDPESDRAARLALHQLYHVLNHINLFGRGYLGQARAVAARLPGGR